MARKNILLGAVLGAAVAVLLPSTATAEIINVYPGPDDEWNYLYDYGDVEVGSSWGHDLGTRVGPRLDWR